MSIVGGLKRSRDESEEGGAQPLQLRESTRWKCLFPGSCVASPEGTFGSAAECEAHPRCAPGSEDRLIARRHLRNVATHELVALESEVCASSRVRLVLPAGLASVGVDAAVVACAWAFYGGGEAGVAACITAGNGGAILTSHDAVVLAGRTRTERMDHMAAPWPGVAEPALSHAALVVAVTLPRDVAALDAAAMAYVQLPSRAVRAALFPWRSNDALLVIRMD